VNGENERIVRTMQCHLPLGDRVLDRPSTSSLLRVPTTTRPSATVEIANRRLLPRLSPTQFVQLNHLLSCQSPNMGTSFGLSEATRSKVMRVSRNVCNTRSDSECVLAKRRQHPFRKPGSLPCIADALIIFAQRRVSTGFTFIARLAGK
jgi:hypothetical protein